jgi:hypothetical protein
MLHQLHIYIIVIYVRFIIFHYLHPILIRFRELFPGLIRSDLRYYLTSSIKFRKVLSHLP